MQLGRIKLVDLERNGVNIIIYSNEHINITKNTNETRMNRFMTAIILACNIFLIFQMYYTKPSHSFSFLIYKKQNDEFHC